MVDFTTNRSVKVSLFYRFWESSEKKDKSWVKEEETEIPRRIRIEMTVVALDDSFKELVRMSRDGISGKDFRIHLQSCNDAMNKACYYLKKLEGSTAS